MELASRPADSSRFIFDELAANIVGAGTAHRRACGGRGSPCVTLRWWPQAAPAMSMGR
jgi:hypothetical protein